MSLPLVSIIIPCFNQGQFIKATVKSAQEQTYSNIEIIVVDDGSTDIRTQKALSEISSNQVTVIRKKNTGVAETRNVGIINSKGKYVLPLDGDDLLGSTYVSKAVGILEEFGDVKVVTTLVKYFGRKNTNFTLPQYSLDGLMGQNLFVCTSMFRRNDFDNTAGFNINMKDGFEDWDFWLSLLKHGGGVHTINEVLFFYRLNKGSRNSSLTMEVQKKLRNQIYLNHRELYSSRFFDPQLSFEYQNIINSKEYRIGTFLLKPVRYIIDIFKL